MSKKINPTLHSINMMNIPWISSLVMLIILSFKSSISRLLYTNSDSLYLEKLFITVTQKGDSLASWVYPNAPAFFTDFPLFSIFRIITNDPFWALLASSFTLFIFLEIAIIQLYRAISPNKSLGFLLLFLSLLNIAIALDVFPLMKILTLSPMWHVMLTVVSLLSYSIFIRHEAGAKIRKREKIALLLLIPLVVFSDKLAIVFIAFPLLVLTLYKAFLKKDPLKSYVLYIKILVLAVIGLSLTYILIPLNGHHFHYSIGVEEILGKILLSTHTTLRVLLYEKISIAANGFAFEVETNFRIILALAFLGVGSMLTPMIKRLEAWLAVRIVITALAMSSIGLFMIKPAFLVTDLRLLLVLILSGIVIAVATLDSNEILQTKINLPPKREKWIVLILFIAIAINTWQSLTKETTRKESIFYEPNIACIEEVLEPLSPIEGTATFWIGGKKGALPKDINLHIFGDEFYRGSWVSTPFSSHKDLDMLTRANLEFSIMPIKNYLWVKKYLPTTRLESCGEHYIIAFFEPDSIYPTKAKAQHRAATDFFKLQKNDSLTWANEELNGLNVSFFESYTSLDTIDFYLEKGRYDITLEVGEELKSTMYIEDGHDRTPIMCKDLYCKIIIKLDEGSSPSQHFGKAVKHVKIVTNGDREHITKIEIKRSK